MLRQERLRRIKLEALLMVRAVLFEVDDVVDPGDEPWRDRETVFPVNWSRAVDYNSAPKCGKKMNDPVKICHLSGK